MSKKRKKVVEDDDVDQVPPAKRARKQAIADDVGSDSDSFSDVETVQVWLR